MANRTLLLTALAAVPLSLMAVRYLDLGFSEATIPKDIDRVLENAGEWTVYRVSSQRGKPTVHTFGPFNVHIEEQVQVPGDECQSLLRAIRAGVKRADNRTIDYVAAQAPEFMVAANGPGQFALALFELEFERVSFSRRDGEDPIILNTTAHPRDAFESLFQ